jgi:rRNA maturation protein Rpf1
MRSFCRDLLYSIPDVIRVNRGKMSLDALAEKALELEADRVIVVEKWRDKFAQLSLFKMSPTGLLPVAPVICLSNVSLRRELSKGTKRHMSSVVTVPQGASSEVERTALQISQFLRLPLMRLDDAVEEHRASLHFAFNSSRSIRATFMLLGRMVEIGPRLTVSKLVWNVSS